MKPHRSSLLIAGLLVSSAGIAAPTVSGDVITFPSTPGWYQVQETDWSNVCQAAAGGNCQGVANGSYIVTNLTNGDRWYDIVVDNVPGGPGGTGSGRPTVEGSSIVMPSTDGWYQVQRPDWSSVCEAAPGGRCDNVANGRYIVTNLNNRDRWDDIEVTDGGTNNGCHRRQVNSATPLRQIIEHCDFPRQDFLLGIAVKTNFGQPWMDYSVSGCIATRSSADIARYGRCFNGPAAGNALAHQQLGKLEFNIITAEGHQKMSESQPSRPSTDILGGADLNAGFERGPMVNLMNTLGVNSGEMALHGHTLAFETSSVGSVIPAWFASVRTQAEARAIMKDRVERELRYYKGKNVAYWDVVNEILPANPAEISALDLARFGASPATQMVLILNPPVA